MKRNAMIALGLAFAFVLGAGTAVYTAERHPHIQAAMRALNNAANQLGRAAHVYGGHREKALELVRAAEAEPNAALQYADRQNR
jgi:hypothetical protein